MPKIAENYNEQKYLTLATSDIHVWLFMNYFKNRKRCKPFLLSDDELLKANNYRYPVDIIKYMIRKSILRETLSFYLGGFGQNIEFDYNLYGKPLLKNGNIFFNSSHSNDLYAIIVSANPECGIDVEYKNNFDGLNEVALNYFSDNEIIDFKSVHPKDRINAFYNCWTRKEAFIKAIGKGVSFGLKNFDVSLKPEDEAEIKVINHSSAGSWSLKQILISEDYTGAISVNHKNWNLRIFNS